MMKSGTWRGGCRFSGRCRHLKVVSRRIASLRLPDVHPEQAPAKIQEAVLLIGDELRGDLVKAVAALDHDAGLPEHGQVFGDDVEGAVRAFGELAYHVLIGSQQLLK